MKYYVNITDCPNQDFKLKKLESADTMLNGRGGKLEDRD